MPRPFGDMITIGQIVKPQGVKGEVLVRPLSDRPDRFPDLERAFLPGPKALAREVRITSCWPHKGGFVLKLEGIDDMDAAELLRGMELRIGEEELAPLPKGEYYHHQLKGMMVLDEAGVGLGVAEDIMETGSAPVLVVRGPEGEVLLPLAEDFVVEIDVPGGRMVVRRPRYVEKPQNQAAG